MCVSPCRLRHLRVETHGVIIRWLRNKRDRAGKGEKPDERKKEKSIFLERLANPLANCSWDVFSNCYLCYSHIRKLINYLARSFFLNIQARLHKWARPTPPQFLVWLPGRIFKTLYQVTNSMFEHV